MAGALEACDEREPNAVAGILTSSLPSKDGTPTACSRRFRGTALLDSCHSALTFCEDNEAASLLGCPPIGLLDISTIPYTDEKINHLPRPDRRGLRSQFGQSATGSVGLAASTCDRLQVKSSVSAPAATTQHEAIQDACESNFA